MNEKLLKERVVVLHSILARTYKDYFNPNTNQGQRGLFETVIGATIWYLPGGGELFSRRISVQALRSLESNPKETKLVEEHSFPRKVGGRFLYEKFRETDGKITMQQLQDFYVNKLGKFNLVLKSENDALKKYQKIENMNLGEHSFLEFCETNLEAHTYSQAGIELVDFPLEKYKEFKRYKSRLKKGFSDSNFEI